jgi:SAM-dependent methyltransferase
MTDVLIQIARRAFRALFPRLVHPLLDRTPAKLPADDDNARRYAEAIEGMRDPFVVARYEEGRRWREVVLHYTGPRPRVLDVGGGNGAIELAMSAAAYAVSVEALWNPIAHRLGVRRVIARAEAMPFREGTFDAMVVLDTIEHFHDVEAISAEMARVARKDAVLLITTPPRLRWLLRPDPHFAIRGLLMLPSSVQRRIVERRGYRGEDHFVDRIYWSIPQLARRLREFRVADVLTRGRGPRRWWWDAVVMRRR